MKLNRTPEQWAQIKPDAFLDGSIVQARNVIEMAQQDIHWLSQELAEARALVESKFLAVETETLKALKPRAIETAPKDGTPVLISVTARWMPYKPASEQYRHGIKGRWQTHNGHGWENMDEPPVAWMPTEAACTL